jgi:di- and tripeptidase
MASIFGARTSSLQQTRCPVVVQPIIADAASIQVDDDTAESVNGFGESQPELLHRVQHDSSILTVAVSDHYIYAGTQEGDILAWSLNSFELAVRLQAHKRAVLCLFLSQDGELLFSSAGDAIVNAWCPKNLKHLYHIYSTYDVGDVFSVAYSTTFQTAYFGAQNTSIQWCSLKDSSSRPTPNEERHPDRRNHRFFDSVAAGATSTPRLASAGRAASMPTSGDILEVDKAHMKHYAHFGYVYCMLLVRGASRLVELEDDMLISGGGDGTIKLWKLSANPDDGIKELASLGEDDAESVLSLTVDGSFLYSGKLEGVIELWDLDTKQKLRVIKAQKGDVMTMQMGWGFLWSAGATGHARVYPLFMLCHNWS